MIKKNEKMKKNEEWTDWYYGHVQMCPTTPRYILCFYGCLITHKKINFVSQLICEVSWFKESCIPIGLEVFGP